MVVVVYGSISGGDGLFAVGNWLKGSTSGNYARILAVHRGDSGTAGAVIVQKLDVAGFTLGELLNELSSIPVSGGDVFTGDTATQDSLFALKDHSVVDGRLGYIDVDFEAPYTEKWSANVAGGAANLTGIDTDGYLVVVIESSSGLVSALRIDDGSEVVWRTGGLGISHTFISNDGRWVVVSNITDIFVLNADDGIQIGTKVLANVVSHAGNGDETFVVQSTGVVTLQDTKVTPTPTQSWTHTIVGSPVLHGCAIGWRYGYVAHAADSGGDVLTLMNLYNAAGTVKATATRDNASAGSKTLLDVCFDGERIYTCGLAATPAVGPEVNTVAYDETGVILWETMCGAATKQAGEIYCDQRWVFVRDEDGIVYILDKRDGRIIETFTVTAIVAQGYICADGDKVYVAGDFDGAVPGNIRAYTLGSGSQTFQKCDVSNINRRPFMHRVIPSVRGLR